MTGLGGLNKSPHGVVLGLVQLQLPVVATPADLAAQTERIVAMVGKARRNHADHGARCLSRVLPARAVDGHQPFMHDMVHGRFKLPWEDEVVVKDGTSCGFAAPVRSYAGAAPAKKAA